MHLFLGGEEGGEPRYAVDLPPDTAHQMIRDGFRLDRLEHLLFTHSDTDHFDPTYLSIRPSILSDRSALAPLTLYGSTTVQAALSARVPDLGRLKAAFQAVTPFVGFRAGALHVFPLRASHGPTIALNYIIQTGDRSVLLAWDTGWWPDDTWGAVARFRFDAVFMECTVLGLSDANPAGHLTFPALLRMRERLRQSGCIHGSTPWVLVHIGDNGGLTHDEACALAEPHGITVGYDGLWLEV
jgi:phosphoribosyl 1,2-cyclic phosphate phosphodiesterase